MSSDEPHTRRARKSIIEKRRFRQSVYAEEAEIHGYLGKKGGGLMAKYNLRFFELSGHYLSYYTDKKKQGGVLGAIDMVDATAATQGGSENDKVKIELRADLTGAGTKGSSTLLTLRAESPADAGRWAQALQAKLAELAPAAASGETPAAASGGAGAGGDGEGDPAAASGVAGADEGEDKDEGAVDEAAFTYTLDTVWSCATDEGGNGCFVGAACGEHTSSADLREELACVLKQFEGTSKGALDVLSVQRIENPSLKSASKELCEKLNQRIEDGGLHSPGRWRRDGESALLKCRVAEVLDARARPVGAHAEHVRSVLAFAGCAREVCPLICKTGFANLALTDDGYFGTGVYLTPNSAYAAVYAAGKKPLAEVELGAEMFMIAADVFVGNTYPITRSQDYRKSLFRCDHRGRTVGTGTLAGYDSHFALVSRDFSRDGEEGWYQAAMDGAEQFEYSEIVVAREHQVLPRWVLQCRRVAVPGERDGALDECQCFDDGLRAVFEQRSDIGQYSAPDWSAYRGNNAARWLFEHVEPPPQAKAPSGRRSSETWSAQTAAAVGLKSSASFRVASQLPAPTAEGKEPEPKRERMSYAMALTSGGGGGNVAALAVEKPQAGGQEDPEQGQQMPEKGGGHKAKTPSQVWAEEQVRTQVERAQQQTSTSGGGRSGADRTRKDGGRRDSRTGTGDRPARR